MSPEDSVRKVGTHTKFLTLFIVAGSAITLAIVSRMPPHPLPHTMPTPLQIALRIGGIFSLLGIIFWFSTAIMIYRSIRTLRSAGIKASWAYLVISILTPFFAIPAGFAFYLSYKEAGSRKPS